VSIHLFSTFFLMSQSRVMTAFDDTICSSPLYSSSLPVNTIICSYTALIHDRVREEPSYSVLLRAGFVKLSSILDVPLTRINEVYVPMFFVLKCTLFCSLFFFTTTP